MIKKNKLENKSHYFVEFKIKWNESILCSESDLWDPSNKEKHGQKLTETINEFVKQHESVNVHLQAFISHPRRQTADAARHGSFT